MFGKARAGLCLAALSAFTIGTLGSAWYARPIRDVSRVGVDARQLWSHGRCATSLTEATCLAAVTSSATPAVMDEVLINPWSRSLIRASRSWTTEDSAKWSASLDSLRSVAHVAGGQVIPCDATGTGFPVSEAWLLGQHELRLYGAVVSRSPPRRWFVSAQYVRRGAAGCGPYVTRRRLSASELAGLFGVWLREHVEF